MEAPDLGQVGKPPAGRDPLFSSCGVSALSVGEERGVTAALFFPGRLLDPPAADRLCGLGLAQHLVDPARKVLRYTSLTVQREAPRLV